MGTTKKTKKNHNKTSKRSSSVLMIGSSMTKNIMTMKPTFSFHAKSGYTSSDVLLWIRSHSEKISAFTTILLFIGNNDTDVDLFERNMREIIWLLSTNVHRIIVLTPTVGPKEIRSLMREIVLRLGVIMNIETIDLWKKIGMSELDSTNHLNRRGNRMLLNMIDTKLKK